MRLLAIFFYIQLSFTCLPLFPQTDSLFIANPRPKLFEFGFRGVTDFPLNAKSSTFGDSDAEVNLNQRFFGNIDIPVLVNSNRQLLVGVKGLREEFEFENIRQNIYPLYQNLEDRHLNSFGMRFLFRKKTTKDKYYLIRGGLDLNGDEIRLSDFSKTLKTNLLFLWGKKKDARTEIGYGVGFSYDLGAPLAYPIFLFHKNFGKNWCLLLDLPKKVNIQYAFSPKTYLFLGSEISGASYRLSNEVLAGIKSVELRYSEIRTTLRIEQEIHDWLWVKGEGGIISNLNLYLSEPGNRKKNSLVDTSPFGAKYIAFSLFIVPPQKFLNRF